MKTGIVFEGGAIRTVYSCGVMDALRTRAERYNADREEMFRAEREGRLLVFAPDSTESFSRTERDQNKIKALWQQGYDHTLSRTEELKRFLRAD